jgi:ABC-2 type transport system ATP-binding protein
VVIDHGRVVHDGTLDELHARYASQRRVQVDLDSPLLSPVDLPDVVLVDSAEDGRRLTFALADGSGAGALVAHLATVGALRDLRLLEPDIEDVVARLYAQSPGPPTATVALPDQVSRR